MLPFRYCAWSVCAWSNSHANPVEKACQGERVPAIKMDVSVGIRNEWVSLIVPGVLPFGIGFPGSMSTGEPAAVPDRPGLVSVASGHQFSTFPLQRETVLALSLDFFPVASKQLSQAPAFA